MRALQSLKAVALFAVLSLSAILLHAQQPSDTAAKHPTRLREVRVSAVAPRNNVSTTAPTQTISQETLERHLSSQLSDVAKEFTGVTIRDYGGIGGIKSFSARGLSSQFSSLVIDGIVVGDAQNGQVDLGSYLVEGVRHVSFTSSQYDGLLQSARAYSAGNLLSLESSLPTVDKEHPTRLRLAFRGGSFGLLAPSLAWQQRVTEKLSFSLQGNHTRCRGDYPFTLYYTSSRQDSSSREVRRNSQMHSTTLDANLLYRPSDQRHLSIKAHHLSSYHALPGPVRLYHIKASEHSEERLSFVQARYRLNLHAHSLQLLGKLQQSLDIYEDTAAPNTQGNFIHNDYRQRELYGSLCYRYTTPFGLSVAASGDAWHSSLLSNLPRNSHVSRSSLLAALAAEYAGDRLAANANLLVTAIADMPADAPQQRYPTKLTPYCGVNYTIASLPRSSLKARLYYKETYRIPTFNELYYYTVSHVLQPEHAHQVNLGLAHTRLLASGKGRMAATVDAYHNLVSNKIIAMPMQNMYLWSMANLGKVGINGLDTRVDLDMELGGVEWTAHLSYSLQCAVDSTTPGSKTYGHQIPYTPRHSGGAGLAMHSRWVDVVYDVMCVGKRYSLQQNTPQSELPAYADHSVAIGRQFVLRKDRKPVEITARFKVQNLFDVQYEVVRNYPMMGRNYLLVLILNI